MAMEVKLRMYSEKDLNAMTDIWNQVVEEGIAFPQTELLNIEGAAAFFSGQTCCGVAEDEEKGEILGLYILHPNNIGRCGHISNASYAVKASARNRHIGAQLVRHCMEQAKQHSFRILQFNAVVKTNAAARHLYESLGFTQLGTIPGGFLMKDGHYEDICPYYCEL